MAFEEAEKLKQFETPVAPQQNFQAYQQQQVYGQPVGVAQGYAIGQQCPPVYVAPPQQLATGPRIEPPSENVIIWWGCFTVFFCGFLTAIPVFVAFTHRRDAVRYFDMGMIDQGNEKSKSSHNWLKCSYVCAVLGFILLCALVALNVIATLHQ